MIYRFFRYMNWYSLMKITGKWAGLTPIEIRADHECAS